MTIKYTHKGWIGLCPVYIGNIDGEAVDVDTRYPFTMWLLHLCLFIFDTIGMFIEDNDGEIPIRITGKLANVLENPHS